MVLWPKYGIFLIENLTELYVERFRFMKMNQHSWGYFLATHVLIGMYENCILYCYMKLAYTVSRFHWNSLVIGFNKQFGSKVGLIFTRKLKKIKMLFELDCGFTQSWANCTIELTTTTVPHYLTLCPRRMPLKLVW